MKVLYDYQIFRRQRYGGISRYFTNLVRYANEDETIVTCHHSKNYYYNQLIGGYDYKYESMIFEQINNSISRFVTNRRIKRGDIEVVHPTYTDAYFLKSLRDEKVVITIHDLAIERYPDRFSKSSEFIDKRKKLIEVADHIIAVSENTKNELIDYYKVDSDRVTVVYHGLPKEFGKISIHLRGLPEHYLLYVGQRGGNKNFSNFIEAFAQLKDANPHLSLLCVGGGEFTEEERKQMARLSLDKRVQQRNLNDAVLAACYKQAEAFVFPSLYEGFGIPILEAFAMRCPIVLSSIGSFQEIAGDHGTYFNPEEVADMAATIQWVIDPQNKDEVLRRVEAGSEALGAFTLEHTYNNTYKVYEKVMKAST